ncbi:MAG: exopolyphosphatase [Shewanella sp.]
MIRPRYAAITLGSNSFNMLVAETVTGQPSVIAKYKRKVRLAEGILDDGSLSEEVLLRGLDCLSMFAEMLEKECVNSDSVAVIATATLRNIANSDDFCRRALTVLAHPIEIITGLREAELIYQGMVATTCDEGRRLVIDIGGASTEFIIGDGANVLLKNSLAIGCVTFNEQFFNSYPLQELDFEDAKLQVEHILGAHLKELKTFGWHSVVGASGSVQSIVELLSHRDESTSITADVLNRLKQEVLAQSDLSMAEVAGLNYERAPTFAAGIAILLALFELLNIEKLNLSGGALREGVLQILANRL